MAVDTAAKRYAAMNFGCGHSQLAIGADDAISNEDRAQSVLVYAGNTLLDVTTLPVMAFARVVMSDLRVQVGVPALSAKVPVPPLRTRVGMEKK